MARDLKPIMNKNESLFGLTCSGHSGSSLSTCSGRRFNLGAVLDMLRSVKNGGAGGNRTLVLLRSLVGLPSNRNQISPIKILYRT